jgi:signal transduction histidine kinase
MEITVAVVPDANDRPRFIQSIGRDITERKKAEQEQIRLLEAIGHSQEQLRLLTFHLQEVQETERREIASVLHDRVGQNLTGLNLILQMIQNQLKPETNPVKRDRLNEALQIVEEITRQVRDVMVDLHPPLLEEYGLFSALDWYSGVFSQRSGMTVQVVGGEFSPRLTLSVETVLFRIAQEALNNVAKHARASHVTLRLGSNGNGPCLDIEDDGLGLIRH